MTGRCCHPCPNLEFENKLWNDGFSYIAGIDEAGRGALAGPVAAGAVVLVPTDTLAGDAVRRARFQTNDGRKPAASIGRRSSGRLR